MQTDGQTNNILNLDFRQKRRRPQDVSSMNVSGEDIMGILSMFDPYGVWRLDIDTNRVFWTDDVYRIHEMDVARGDVDLELAVSRYHPEDQIYLTQVLEEAIVHRSAFRFVLRLKRANHGYKLVKSTGCWRETADGRPEMIGTFSEFQPANRAIAAVG